MSQRTMAAHYEPNARLAEAFGLSGYNCGIVEEGDDGTFDDHQRRLVWRLLGAVRPGPDDVVLDVGCGIGGPASWMAERFAPRTVIGIDYCRPSVAAAARSRGGHRAALAFCQGDSQRLPVADGCIDVVFSLESALHYPDKPAFLRECRRVLKPGGALCLGDITTNQKLFFSAFRWLNSVPTQFNSNMLLWSADDYRDGLAAAGFRVDRHEEVSRDVARSLSDGLAEIRRRGWRASRGYRGRYVLLSLLQKYFATAELTYDLFTARTARARAP